MDSIERRRQGVCSKKRTGRELRDDRKGKCLREVECLEKERI